MLPAVALLFDRRCIQASGGIEKRGKTRAPVRLPAAPPRRANCCPPALRGTAPATRARREEPPSHEGRPARCRRLRQRRPCRDQKLCRPSAAKIAAIYVGRAAEISMCRPLHTFAAAPRRLKKRIGGCAPRRQKKRIGGCAPRGPCRTARAFVRGPASPNGRRKSGSPAKVAFSPRREYASAKPGAPPPCATFAEMSAQREREYTGTPNGARPAPMRLRLARRAGRKAKVLRGTSRPQRAIPAGENE